MRSAGHRDATRGRDRTRRRRALAPAQGRLPVLGQRRADAPQGPRRHRPRLPQDPARPHRGHGGGGSDAAEPGRAPGRHRRAAGADLLHRQGPRLPLREPALRDLVRAAGERDPRPARARSRRRGGLRGAAPLHDARARRGGHHLRRADAIPGRHHPAIRDPLHTAQDCKRDRRRLLRHGHRHRRAAGRPGRPAGGRGPPQAGAGGRRHRHLRLRPCHRRADLGRADPRPVRYRARRAGLVRGYLPRRPASGGPGAGGCGGPGRHPLAGRVPPGVPGHRPCRRRRAPSRGQRHDRVPGRAGRALRRHRPRHHGSPGRGGARAQARGLGRAIE
ncbi:hypothetical protein AEGHOMDF_2185 [Methylobacterium soli]|nr:hypothetical protein AEGHOMDF_2185 [Methylobacterium soli]